MPDGAANTAFRTISGTPDEALTREVTIAVDTHAAKIVSINNVFQFCRNFVVILVFII